MIILPKEYVLIELDKVREFLQENLPTQQKDANTLFRSRVGIMLGFPSHKQFTNYLDSENADTKDNPYITGAIERWNIDSIEKLSEILMECNKPKRAELNDAKKLKEYQEEIDKKFGK